MPAIFSLYCCIYYILSHKIVCEHFILWLRCRHFCATVVQWFLILRHKTSIFLCWMVTILNAPLTLTLTFYSSRNTEKSTSTKWNKWQILCRCDQVDAIRSSVLQTLRLCWLWLIVTKPTKVVCIMCLGDISFVSHPV